MTDQPRRPPTPLDLTAAVTRPRCGAPLTGAACQAPATDTVDTPPPGPPYERTRWEAAVLARRMHFQDTLVALVLSHYAGVGGFLAEDGAQRVDLLRGVTGLRGDSVRMALKNLQKAGLLWRPPGEAGTPTHRARPITLTVPVRRERPPHPGERP